MPTYPDQETMLLDFDIYVEKNESRGVKTIKLRRTQTFENLSGLEIDVLDEHTWSFGDSLLKLSNKFYNAPNYWWIIAFINKKPTDAHFKIGDILYIPSNPQFIEGQLRQ